MGNLWPWLPLKPPNLDYNYYKCVQFYSKFPSYRRLYVPYDTSGADPQVYSKKVDGSDRVLLAQSPDVTEPHGIALDKCGM